jgi:hypothetical protein
MVFGYPGRVEYRDSQGSLWQSGTEFTVRTGNLTDAVAKTWWTVRQAVFVEGTQDPELYRYGVHAPDFTVDATVGPGAYHLRLKFAETQYAGPGQRGITIFVNGQEMTQGLDVWATAGGINKAVDVVYNDIHPQNGVVAVRFVGSKVNGCQQDAMLQALEIGPGEGEAGSTPKTISALHPDEGPEQNRIVYIQAVRYKNSLTPERAEAMLESLKNTLGAIPQVKSVQIGRVVDDNQKKYDYAVIMTFNNLEDKRTYGQSEIHQRWVRDNKVIDLIDQHLMLTIQTDFPEK